MLFAGVLLVGLIGGCAGGAGNDGAAAPSGGASSGTEWQTKGCGAARPSAEVDAFTGEVQQAGEARFADVFAGLEVVPEQSRTIVYRKPSAEFDEYLREAAGGQCLVVRDAEHSQVELMALVKRISDDTAYWRGRGITINTVGPRHDGSGVEVGTQQVSAARVELPSRYGPAAPVFVVEQGPVVPLTAN